MNLKSILIALSLLITTCLLLGCSEVSKNGSDIAISDFSAVQQRIAELQEELRIERVEVAKLREDLTFYQDENLQLRSELTRLQIEVLPYKLPSNRTIADCVEPLNTMVRARAVSIVADAPYYIDADSPVWKIWQINFWVVQNIYYISDPNGQQYLSYAHETLGIGGGDCDDFAILLASLYESVGLDAAIGEIDTDSDGEIDHMACLVYYPQDSKSFLEQEEMIMKWVRYSSPTGCTYVCYFVTKRNNPVLSKYDSGIWILADPLTAKVKAMVGYNLLETEASWETYKAINIIDVGS